MLQAAHLAEAGHVITGPMDSDTTSSISPSLAPGAPVARPNPPRERTDSFMDMCNDDFHSFENGPHK